MSHFARINSENIVEEVIVAEQDHIDTLEDPSSWIQTSYNTGRGKHHAPNSHDEDDGVALRKNYAGIGYTYDLSRDAFIPKKPYPSWGLNEDTCHWEAPVPEPSKPEGPGAVPWVWDEPTESWKEAEIPE
tara:strand:- start:1709 stop:2098 length:390 start_codon:yes stop_codon:yes gene_type:complete